MRIVICLFRSSATLVDPVREVPASVYTAVLPEASPKEFPIEMATVEGM